MNLSFKMAKFNSINILELFLILIPAAIILGPFFADLLVVLSVVIFILYLSKDNLISFLKAPLNKQYPILNLNFSFPKDKFLAYFLIFYLFISINSIFNNGSFYSIKPSLTFIRFIFFYLTIVFICERCEKNFFKKLYNIFILIFTILFIDSFSELIFDKNILDYKALYYGRISSLFGDELILGSYISKLIPLFVYLHIKRYGFVGKTLKLFTILVITYFTVLISGERVAFLSINLFYVLIAAYYIRHYLSKKLLFLIMVIFIINTVIFSSFSSVKDRYFQKTYNQVIYKNSGKIEGSNIKKNTLTEKINNNSLFSYVPYEYRLYFLTAVNIFRDNFILGKGTKSFRYVCSDKKYVISESYSCSTHPHNFYFQMLSENGIIGFGFLLLLNIYFLFVAIKMLLFKKKYNLSYPLVSGIFVFYFPFIFTGSVFNNMVCIFSFFVMGFYAYEKKLRYND